MDAEMLANIMKTLGRLEEGQAHSSESRGRLYTKLEKIEADIADVGKVATEGLATATEVQRLVATDVKPVTDEIKRMKLMGLGALALLGFAFTLLGMSLATVGTGVLSAIRGWLPGS